MKKKDELDKLMEEIGADYSLDDEQKAVVLFDDGHCLVVAGAGAGKTSTVAAKVLYLTNYKNVDQSHILVISFTNKAVEELKERIQEQYGLKDCVISTFHSVGFDMLKDPNQDVEPKVLDSETAGEWIAEIFRDLIMKDEDKVKDIIFFFSYYLDAPDEEFFLDVADGDREELRSSLISYLEAAIKGKSLKTINGDLVRSNEERQIADFLFIYGIPYEYEPAYPYGSPGENNTNIYRPDFLLKRDGEDVYLEHFGVSEEGKNDRYDPETEKTYNKHIEDKKKLHNEKGTELIWTYSKYNDEKPLLTHLEQLLEDEGFQLCFLKDEETKDKVVDWIQNQYERRMVSLIRRFISDVKAKGYDMEKIRETYPKDNDILNARSNLFLDICEACYNEYERRLEKEGMVDFDGMVNQSVEILEDIKNGDRELGVDYEYIFVDEYQDISRQRFDFTKALSEVTNAKINAVGDDWQSIYAFSGSDITLFTKKFMEELGTDNVLKITNTYRNSQELIDVAGNFIQKNPEQIAKSLQSQKHLESPVMIYTYQHDNNEEEDWITQENKALAETVETVLENLISEKERDGKKPGRILLLGRYNFDIKGLISSKKFSWKNGRIECKAHPELELDFMTVHSSKGLGYDDVILLNGRNGTYGFPSKLTKDPVLDLIPGEDDLTNSEEEFVDYAEERRLFYVALTRTKNRVYIIAPHDNPSEFLIEIMDHDTEQPGKQNVVLEGGWGPQVKERKMPHCPMCGFPLIHRPKKNNPYGVDIYVCSNEPEICDFITNDPRGEKMSITKCPDCDGYLIVKHNSMQDVYFLGCQNFYSEGCERSISMKQFYEDNGYQYPHDD